MSELLVLKKLGQCTPFLSPPTPGEATALMKRWKNTGIEETVSKAVNVDVCSSQGSTQQKRQAAPVKLAHPHGKKPSCDTRSGPEVQLSSPTSPARSMAW